MENQVNLLMLACAALAALALGVLLGYACCKGLFAMLRLHARSHALKGAEASIPSTLAS